nr:hypothetical protein WG33_0137 [uncultured bacterium]
MKVTYLIVPAVTDMASRLRIVKCRHDLAQAPGLREYREHPEMWQEAGYVSRGRLICHANGMRRDEPLLPPTTYTFIEGGTLMMTDEQIQAELSRDIEIIFPKTVADGLTQAFNDDWQFRRLVLQGSVEETARVTLKIQFSVPIEVARVHLDRIMQIEATLRGK